MVRKNGKYWNGACTCNRFWVTNRWSDAFQLAFNHVTGRRKIETLGGVGFNIHHKAKPLDAYEDMFRCACGTVFNSSTGYAVCPNLMKGDV